MPYIDPSWEPVEGQEGLYVESYTITNPFTGNLDLRRILHSADGYCFYDLADEYYDEDGNLIPNEDVPPTMRVYAQYMSISPYRNLSDFISVPIQEGFEIVSVPNNTETI